MMLEINILLFYSIIFKQKRQKEMELKLKTKREVNWTFYGYYLPFPFDDIQSNSLNNRV